jgi:hypothetical protein
MATPTSNYAPAPAAAKQTSPSAYLDFTSTAGQGWAQQYLPDLLEKEAEVFGNRSISGFLSKVGAEEAMASDQVVWSEQGRLHLSYAGSVSGEVITLSADADGVSVSGSAHGVRKGDMVLVADANATAKCYVTKVNAAAITVKPYTAANLSGAGISNAVKVLVFGSEFVKGSTGRDSVNEPGFKSFSNNPIIIKDKYEVSGSDASAIGWVEVSGEEGQSGYLWYLKAEGDTRARFSDYLEMVCIESEKVDSSSTLDTVDNTAGAEHGVLKGTEGLFAAINDRGNVTAGIDGTSDLGDFDEILKTFDKNGAIEENMMFLDRATSLLVDDMLAGMNSYGSDGTSYGVFDNDTDMALNLGFSGFRRGSYDFYKSDWKYLNDASTRGIINGQDGTGAIRGTFIPAGASTVYDQALGKNLIRPFRHVRYRASQTESRQYKTWVTGSVGAATSDLDAMEVNYLSERCLVVQGANNFMLLS